MSDIGALVTGARVLEAHSYNLRARDAQFWRAKGAEETARELLEEAAECDTAAQRLRQLAGED